MAFYIVSKGHITPFTFQYLDSDIPVRLERTLLHGQPAPPHQERHFRDYYAYELMTKKVITLSPAARLQDARELMHKNNIHHLPLIVDHKLTGLISSKDIANLTEDSDLDRIVRRMTKLIVCASDTTPVRHVVEVFYRENINALPVVDDELRMTGIITHRDILKWLIANQKLLKEYDSD